MKKIPFPPNPNRFRGQTYDEEKEEADDELHEDEEINADGGDLIGSFFGLLSTFKSRWLSSV